MQLTRVLYQGLMRAAGYIMLSLFVFLNGVLVYVAAAENEAQINAQHIYIHTMLEQLGSDPNQELTQSGVNFYNSIHELNIQRLSNDILGWEIITKDGTHLAGKRFKDSWNLTETLFKHDGYDLVISHNSLIVSHLLDFLYANVALAFLCLTSIGLTYRKVFPHWKILLQLETWASRYARDERFKFFIKTRDYQLINTIRNINSQRILAQKGGQKIDHYIRSEAFLDPVTGLGNRLYLDNRLEALMQSEQEVYGAILLIHFASLDQLSERKGLKATRSLVKDYSSLLMPYLDDTEQTVVARINYSEFALLLPFSDETEVQKVTQAIIDKAARFDLPHGIDAEHSCYIGVKQFTQFETSFHILAEADLALRAAQLQGPSSWFMYESGNLPKSGVKGSVRWRVTLENALEKGNFVLASHKMESVVGEIEALQSSLILKETDAVISSNIFMPMARKCGLIPQLDMMALELSIGELSKQKQVPLAVRIHIDSWLNRDFDVWLVRFLKKNVEITNRLIFEISEFDLVNNVQAVKPLLKVVKRYGAQVMVVQVGFYVVDLGYLNSVPVDSLMLHKSIGSNIITHKENQMFVRSLNGVASSQKQRVYAAGVDSEKQINALKRLGVSGYVRL